MAQPATPTSWQRRHPPLTHTRIRFTNKLQEIEHDLNQNSTEDWRLVNPCATRLGSCRIKDDLYHHLQILRYLKLNAVLVVVKFVTRVKEQNHNVLELLGPHERAIMQIRVFNIFLEIYNKM